MPGPITLSHSLRAVQAWGSNGQQNFIGGEGYSPGYREGQGKGVGVGMVSTLHIPMGVTPTPPLTIPHLFPMGLEVHLGAGKG